MKILISPLNWGLGHATRIVPLIKLLQCKNEVTVAADGDSFEFLKTEFPNDKILKLKNFNVKYSEKKIRLPVRILFTIPKLLYFYFYNKKWVKNYISENKINLIISDNKFGFFSKKINSVFITHHLNIQVPKVLKIFKPFVDALNNWNINKFDEIWIPDDKKNNISGILAISKKLNRPTYYIGLLSRFADIQLNDTAFKRYEYVAVISGPEPQKTLLTKKIINILSRLDAQCLVIGGKTSEKETCEYKNVHYVNHLNTNELFFHLKNSKVITRAGYSSVMDLILIKQTAILIPTPGQTEQNYLANYLHTNNLFYCVQQEKLSVEVISDFEKNIEQLEKNLKNIDIPEKPKQFLKQRKLI